MARATVIDIFQFDQNSTAKFPVLPKASSSIDATNYNNNDVLSLLLSTFPVERAWWMIYR